MIFLSFCCHLSPFVSIFFFNQKSRFFCYSTVTRLLQLCISLYLFLLCSRDKKEKKRKRKRIRFNHEYFGLDRFINWRYAAKSKIRRATISVSPNNMNKNNNHFAHISIVCIGIIIVHFCLFILFVVRPHNEIYIFFFGILNNFFFQHRERGLVLWLVLFITPFLCHFDMNFHIVVLKCEPTK